MIFARDYPEILRKIEAASKKNTPGGAADELAKITSCGEPAVDETLVDQVRTQTLDAGELRNTKWWQVDHRVPLAAHWQLEGINANDKERNEAATDPGGLQLIARDENLSAGSKFVDKRYGFALEVGPKFSTRFVEGFDKPLV